MAKANLNLKDAEKIRDEVTLRQKRKIKKLYESLAREVAEKAEKYKDKDDIKSVYKTMYLKDIEKSMKVALDEITREIQVELKKSMEDVAESVVVSAKDWLKAAGMTGIEGAFAKVPADVVKSIISGQVYDNGFNLSKRIWSANKKTLDDIHKIIAKGIAENASVYDIAKDLEKYVKPSAKKPWRWNKVYPGTKKVVDYNAQRLARTLTQHAYQQSFVSVTKKNPWITKYRWVSNGAKTCPLCRARDGALFEKHELPLDHPNGACSVVAEFEKSWDDITTDMANWFKSPTGTFPDIDDFANSLF